ncbi:MAG TPA: tRNA epoxyqueuosine(34) reductase QueG [Acidobacteriota bacterium]|nr:tRNA epoxyqueuosine(34) reductase QueG [Acidobacteriota bacterium]
MDRRQLSQAIKQEAYKLGFDSAGIAPVEKLSGGAYPEWIQRGYQGEMSYLERNVEKRLDPTLIVPEAQSIVSLAINYFHPGELPYEDPSQAVISRYAWGDDYHDIIKKRLKQLLEAIQALQSGITGRYYVDTGPVLDKYWAVQAGIGWQGKHTNVLSRSRGSWFFLAEIILDVELEYDDPAQDYCGTCTRCIDACPTDAIVEPYLLDARRCVSYLTIELRRDIPPEFRESMGNLVFGCDICQDVCPWNSRAVPSNRQEFAPRPENWTLELRELARMTPEEFSAAFRKSPVKRTKWRGLMRNVAVALGNTRNESNLDVLEGLLNCEDAMVRRHAAWAISFIGGASALRILHHRLERESDPETREVLYDLTHSR